MVRERGSQRTGGGTQKAGFLINGTLSTNSAALGNVEDSEAVSIESGEGGKVVNKLAFHNKKEDIAESSQVIRPGRQKLYRPARR